MDSTELNKRPCCTFYSVASSKLHIFVTAITPEIHLTGSRLPLPHRLSQILALFCRKSPAASRAHSLPLVLDMTTIRGLTTTADLTDIDGERVQNLFIPLEASFVIVGRVKQLLLSAECSEAI
jgi:hypothetical protein